MYSRIPQGYARFRFSVQNRCQPPGLTELFALRLVHDRSPVTGKLDPFACDRHLHERPLEELRELQGAIASLAIVARLYRHAHGDPIAHLSSLLESLARPTRVSLGALGPEAACSREEEEALPPDRPGPP